MCVCVYACAKELQKIADKEQARYRKEMRAYKLEQKQREAEVIYFLCRVSHYNTDFMFRMLALSPAWLMIQVIVLPTT